MIPMGMAFIELVLMVVFHVLIENGIEVEVATSVMEQVQVPLIIEQKKVDGRGLLLFKKMQLTRVLVMYNLLIKDWLL
jgi:hypothetical protein